MCSSWMGIILNDYEAVFPICYKKKWGITYCYTPAFIQCFSCNNKNENLDLIQKEIQKVAKYGDVMLSATNETNVAQSKCNYILSLDTNYELIYKNYKSDLKQNLKKATKENLVYLQSNDINHAVELYKTIYADRMNGINPNDFKNFKKLCKLFQQSGNCIVREVRNSENNLLAIALLLKDKYRFYNLANSTTILGRKTEANHFLIDRIIHEFSNTNAVFDFEGSDLPGVKTFYQKFGAVNEPYFHWHFNNLPWWIKWAKK